jgi:hypothetical protein
MWPVIGWALDSSFGRSFIACSRSSALMSAGVSQIGTSNGERHGVVRQHEALQGLVTLVVFPYRWDLESRQARGEVFFLPRREACLVEEHRDALGGTGARLEQVMRAACRHGLEEIGKSLKAVMLGALAQKKRASVGGSRTRRPGGDRVWWCDSHERV